MHKRLLLFSDLHAHPWPDCSTLTHWQDQYWINSRLIDAWRTLMWLLHAAQKLKVHDVIHLGDLKHIRGLIHSDTIVVLRDAFLRFHQASIRMHLLVGNHDWDSTCQHHPLEAFRPYVRVYDTVTVQKIAGEPLAFIPYITDPKKTLDAYRSVAHVPHIVGHVALNAVPQRSGYIWGQMLEADSLPSSCGVWSGHYHDPVTVNPRFQYVGAAMQHGWGDEGGERCAWLVTPDAIKKMPIPAPRFQTVTAHALPQSCKGLFVRILVPDTWHTKKRDAAQQDAMARGARHAELLPVSEDDGDSQARHLQVVAGIPPNVQQLIRDYAKAQSKQRKTIGLGVLARAQKAWEG